MPDVVVIGLGFDSHVYSDKGSLMLGGVRFPKEPALKGHSDGDAVLHAVIDALLGAAGLGDIGDFFPDTSKKLKGIASRVLLAQVLKLLSQKKVRPGHVDVTIVANKPRLGPSKVKLKKTLANLLGVSPAHVNIKAKTLEGLKWFSPQEGVAVWTVATLQKTSNSKL